MKIGLAVLYSGWAERRMNGSNVRKLLKKKAEKLPHCLYNEFYAS